MKLLGVIGGSEIIVILLLVLVLFGGKKIPELMKGLGKGVKEYKKAVNGIEDELNGAANTGAPDNEADGKSGRTNSTADGDVRAPGNE